MTTTSGEPVRFDDGFLADPTAAYARLREEAAVHRAVTPDGAAVWLVTRYDEVRAALSDPRLSLDKANARDGYRGLKLPPALDANLLNMDAPEHTRLRRLLGKGFTPRRVEALRTRVREIADELLDQLNPAVPFDLISGFAAPLPIIVICELLGVPAGDRPDFRGWTDEMLAPDPDHPERARDALLALHGFLADLITAKRAAPDDDLISTLLTEDLSQDELTSALFLILFAGYENVVHLFGNGLLTLLTRPGGLREITTSTMDAASTMDIVDELIRFDSPAQLAIRRFPLDDVTIGGVTIPAGDTVMLSLASAHRDAARFSEPDVFDPRRAENPHLGFGHGPHFCMGAPLARLEMEVGLTALLDRFPGLTLAAEPRWRLSFRNRGLRELRVQAGEPAGTRTGPAT